MKKWQARGGTTSDIRLLPLEAEDEDSAREKAREYFGKRRLRPRALRGRVTTK